MGSSIDRAVLVSMLNTTHTIIHRDSEEPRLMDAECQVQLSIGSSESRSEESLTALHSSICHPFLHHTRDQSHQVPSIFDGDNGDGSNNNNNNNGSSIEKYGQATETHSPTTNERGGITSAGTEGKECSGSEKVAKVAPVAQSSTAGNAWKNPYDWEMNPGKLNSNAAKLNGNRSLLNGASTESHAGSEADGESAYARASCAWNPRSPFRALSLSVVGSEEPTSPRKARQLRFKEKRPIRRRSPTGYSPTRGFKFYQPGPLPTFHTVDLPKLYAAPTTAPYENEGESAMDRLPVVGSGMGSSAFPLSQYITPLTTRGGPPIVDGMVQQLRDLICQFDWAQVHMKHVQKRYFDKQHKAMEKAWDALDAAIDEFQKQRGEERSRIAGIRASLTEEKKKLAARNDAARVQQLEGEVARLKEAESKKNSLISELRTKITNLEGMRRAFEESAEKNLSSLKQTRERLTVAETENSSLRTKMRMMKAERSASSSGGSQNSGGGDNSRGVPMNLAANNSVHSILPTPTKNASLLASTPHRVMGTQFSRTPSSDGSHHYPNHQQQMQPVKQLSFTTTSSSGGASGASVGAPSSSQKSVRWSSPIALPNIGSSPPQLPHFLMSSMGMGAASTIGGGGGMPGCMPFPYSIIDANMINTKYEVTRRGWEYTLTDGPLTTLFTELHCHCTVYEYNNGDFRWVGRAGQRIQAYYYDAAEAYEVCSPHGNRILFFLSGQLEVHWKCGGGGASAASAGGGGSNDRTVVMPTGKRIEVFQPSKRGAPLGFEFYDHQRAYKWGEEDEAPQLFQPDPKRMSRRADGSFVSLLEDNSLQIKAPDDFALRRLPSGFVRVDFREVCLQMSLCPCGGFAVKHVIEKSDGSKEKALCYAYGSCNHVDLSSANSSAATSAKSRSATADGQ